MQKLHEKDLTDWGGAQNSAETMRIYFSQRWRKTILETDVQVLDKECDNYRTILKKTEQARSRWSGAPTDEKMINSNASSTRYRRRKETKEMLEYHQGGEEGAKYCAGY